jgi:hypothetical protein
MIGDHHHRTAAKATLLVTAVDEILGTHTMERRIVSAMIRPKFCGDPRIPATRAGRSRFAEIQAAVPRAAAPGLEKAIIVHASSNGAGSQSRPIRSMQPQDSSRPAAAGPDGGTARPWRKSANDTA